MYYYQDGPFSDWDVVEIDSIAVKTNQNRIFFTAEKSQLDSGARGYFQYYIEIELKNDGTLTFNKDRYCTVLNVSANGTAHTLSYDDSVYRGVRRFFGGNIPVSLRLSEEGITTLDTNMIRTGGDDTGKLYATWTDNSGETWEGEWVFQKNSAPTFFRKKEEGGSQDYVIVDALSAITSPKEGMTAWVNSGTQTYGPYTVISFNSSECGGGQLSWDGDYAYLTDSDPTEIDNGNGWSTPTSEWTAVGGRSNLYIKYDSSTHMFSVMFAFNVSNLEVTVYDTTYTETSDTLTLSYDGYFSRRIKGNWIRTEYHLENMTNEERVQAHSEIISMSGQSYTDIFWENNDGGISKANYWLVDWSDNASIRCAANQGDVWYTMTFRSDGSVSEKGNGRVRDKVKRWEFGFNRTTSAFTANSFDRYDGYITWDGDAIIEASVYESTNNYKMSSGNIVHIWKATDGELYNDYYFGFNFVDDTDGTEWKTKWYAVNDSATLVSMAQA